MMYHYLRTIGAHCQPIFKIHYVIRKNCGVLSINLSKVANESFRLASLKNHCNTDKTLALAINVLNQDFTDCQTEMTSRLWA